MSQSKTRTIVALAGAALLVFVAAVAAVVTIAVQHTDKPKPELSAYAHGKSVSVRPFMYCSVHVDNNQLKMEDCDNSQSISDLSVPPGSPLQLSLPNEIFDAPWRMAVVYALPNGQAAQTTVWYSDKVEKSCQIPSPLTPEPANPGKSLKDCRALTIETPADARLRLAGIEFQLPVPARDENGQEGYVPHAVWSIRTAA
ncbi:DUF2771 domain-containing protein [Nocardia yunnanensis]|uniref:DUF2771 domain-containing protein n=1 Tax=Nocardia yunnanensis TaxID=2382165 RepID=A0A386Z6N0_9NOCA|nr:DUF2771 domain-containing protein [Nocardia yunnanensis]AYF73378.1 DUF2771 domain-containing protein [Nocardia yunnanensis]